MSTKERRKPQRGRRPQRNAQQRQAERARRRRAEEKRIARLALVQAEIASAQPRKHRLKQWGSQLFDATIGAALSLGIVALLKWLIGL